MKLEDLQKIFTHVGRQVDGARFHVYAKISWICPDRNMLCKQETYLRTFPRQLLKFCREEVPEDLVKGFGVIEYNDGASLVRMKPVNNKPGTFIVNLIDTYGVNARSQMIYQTMERLPDLTVNHGPDNVLFHTVCSIFWKTYVKLNPDALVVSSDNPALHKIIEETIREINNEFATSKENGEWIQAHPVDAAELNVGDHNISIPDKPSDNEVPLILVTSAEKEHFVEIAKEMAEILDKYNL